MNNLPKKLYAKDETGEYELEIDYTKVIREGFRRIHEGLFEIVSEYKKMCKDEGYPDISDLF